MADVKWIKITTDIFDDEKILLIESLPDSYAIITVWFKLLCLAGKQNNSGVFLMGKIAYTDKMLATIFRMKEATVTMALRTFEEFGMVEIVDGVITIPNWGKHQSLDQLEKKRISQREYMKAYREKQRLLSCKTNCKTNSKANVSRPEGEREEETEKETDYIEHTQKHTPDPQAVVDLYHSICTSFPSVRSLSDTRKKALKARLKTYTLDDFRTVFEKAEASSFLKGTDGGWKASFDWLIKEANMLKVLEGNYADKPKRNGRKEAVPGWCAEGFTPDKAFLEACQKASEVTVGNNPELADRAEKLRQRLGG